MSKGRIIDIGKGSVRPYGSDLFEFFLSGKQEMASVLTDNYIYKQIENDINELQPYIIFDEVSNTIKESPNPDHVLPYIIRKDKDGKYYYYLLKKFKKQDQNNDVKNLIEFSYDSGEPSMKIYKDIPKLKYVIFSRDDDHAFKDMKDEKSQPYVKYDDKSYSAIFYQPKYLSRVEGAQEYIQKARDKAFSLFAYLKIPIVIKVTGSKIDNKYFIKVWKSPFMRYPDLSRILFHKNSGKREYTFYYTSFKSLDKPDSIHDQGNKNDKNILCLDYINLAKINNFERKEKIVVNLPTSIIQKVDRYYPDFNDKLSFYSFLPVYQHFSEVLNNIYIKYQFKYSGEISRYKVLSFLELGYTSMNVELPQMKTNIEHDTDINFLSFIDREKNTNSIMEIATLISKTLFFPSEPGAVQLYRTSSDNNYYLAFYTRNKNSIMANANTISAGLRTSNIVVIPITPMHVSMFIESLDCAFKNWNRFGLAKYDIAADEKITIFFYFGPGQREIDIDMSKTIISTHFSKYDMFYIDFCQSQTELKEAISDNFKEYNNDSAINQLEIMLSVAAFATVNDYADYLGLEDQYEAKSSFVYQ